jgi:hypothetical protein
MPPAADFVTVLQVPSGEPRLSKCVACLAPLIIEPCGNVGEFIFHRTSVTNLNDAARLLFNLQGRPDAAIVRGEPTVVGRGPHVRRALARPGEPATLIPCPRRLFAVDMDGVPLPPGTGLTDIAECGEVARRELPAEFNQAACIVQATGSHGLKPGARLRLWFMCDRPVSDAEAAFWVQDVPSADQKLYHPIQLHYTSAPTFAAGLRDHLPLRLARLSGNSEVAVPPPGGLTPPPRPAWVPPAFRSSAAAQPYVRRELTQTFERVRSAPAGEIHNTLVSASARTVRLVQLGWVPEDKWRAVLTTATLQAAPDTEPYKIDSALDWAMQLPAPGEEFDYD